MCIKTWLNHILLFASQISFRSDIHVGHTQPLNCRHHGKWIVARALSLRALACTSPRIGAYIRNAGETSNARRRRTLQGELPGPGWLVNKPPRFGSVSRVTKFHLSDSCARERAYTRVYALLCTRACPRANARALILYARSTSANVFCRTLDAPSEVLASIKILRSSIAVNIRIASAFRVQDTIIIFMYIAFNFNC